MRRRVVLKSEKKIGNLINNSKELYEQSSINGSTGLNDGTYGDKNRIRSIGYFDIKPNTTYELKNLNTKYKIALRFYKQIGVFDIPMQNGVNFTGFAGDVIFTTNKDVTKFRVVIAYDNNNDIKVEEVENTDFCLVEI